MTRRLRPGDEVDYVVTWLEMTTRPRAAPPPVPAGQRVALLAAKDPPADYFLYLYQAVGAEYDPRSHIRTGPILVGRMTVAGGE